MMMLAYPGYTVRRIEDELSWREIGLLLAEWDQNLQPGFLSLSRLQRMYEKAHGFKRAGGQRQADDAHLLNSLRGQGWIA